MGYFVTQKNTVIGTKSGHCIQFTGGVPTWVPPLAEVEVAHFPGITATTKDAQDAITSAAAGSAGDLSAATLSTTVVAIDPGVVAKFVDGIRQLVQSNDTADFTANGTPKAKSLLRVCGVEPSKLELAESFAAYQRTLQDPATRVEV